MFLEFYQKPIFTSLSPNTEKDDLVLALRLLFRPWKSVSVKMRQRLDQRESAVKTLENRFKQYFDIKHAFAFNSGRTAFLGILKCLDLEPGDEILLQALTCNALVNPIFAAGLKPGFVDIEEKTLNIDANDLEKKISGKSRAVVIQHTFGLPAEIDTILEICRHHNLILIEDCAHALGAKYNGTPVGAFGKAAFFSFGRDKVISSVFGGMAATNDDQLAQRLKNYQDKLPEPSSLWTFQQLLHPILTKFFVMPAYGFFGAGKWLLLFLQKIGLLSKAVSNQEKQGRLPQNFLKKMPEALATIALNQFEKLEKFISHQRQIADLYDKNLAGLGLNLPPNTGGRIYLRYPVLLKNASTDMMLDKARQAKIFLDDGWRKTAIVPPDTNQTAMAYIKGDCPMAESVAKNIVNLPTHINIADKNARRIVGFLKEIFETNGN